MEDLNSFLKEIIRNISGKFLVVDKNLQIFTPLCSDYSSWIKSDNSTTSLESLLGLTNSTVRALKKWISIVVLKKDDWSWNQLEAVVPMKEITIQGLTYAELITYALKYTLIKTENCDLFYIMIQFELQKNLQSLLLLEVSEQEHFKALFEIPIRELSFFVIDTKDKIGKTYSLLKDLMDAHSTKEDDKNRSQEWLADKICLETIFRDLHTIKSSGGTLGLHAIATVTHESETAISAVLDKFPVINSDDLSSAYKSISVVEKLILNLYKKIETYMQNQENIFTKVPSLQLQKIIDLSKSKSLLVPDNFILLRAECLKLEWIPLKHLVKKYHRCVEQIAENLNKNIVFQLKNEGTELFPPTKFERIDSMVLQIVRNSAVHGIENPATRQMFDKGVGIISVEFVQNDCYTKIVVSDNGCGIDCDRLVAKALEKKLIAPEVAETLT